MSAPKEVSEREAVSAKRHAFAIGMFELGAFTWDVCLEHAAREYPLPVSDSGDTA